MAPVRTAPTEGRGLWRPDSHRASRPGEPDGGRVRRRNWDKRNRASSMHISNKKCTRRCRCKPRGNQAADPGRSIRSLDAIPKTCRPHSFFIPTEIRRLRDPSKAKQLLFLLIEFFLCENAFLAKLV